ncbi:Aste57867_15213 [Aphanomyces stellatus]|uniref:Aste57867_15213 protein n=1 Tax=Aphanomyces stellatus TaxID=120398 RepID=A0A485L2N2_9STRA|nr:hypothetical protein As57867_015157 [Aphanomyces stellatus]VFT92022.1 Aste57867_15213 [Aphanomyces stellatus]
MELKMVEAWTQACADSGMEAYLILAVALVASCAVFYYYTERQSKVQLVYNGASKLNQFIAKNCATLNSSYHPPWWAMSAHVQVLLTVLWPQAKVQYSREMVPCKDGGEVALDWVRGADTLDNSAPIVLVLHGLTGASNRRCFLVLSREIPLIGCSLGYRSFCVDALQAGYRPVVFNKRGHGGTVLNVPKLQAFGCVSDMTFVIEHIRRAFPTAPLVGVGFSAGSGLLVSYLGEMGVDSKLDAGVLVSPGYDAVDLFCNGAINAPYNSVLTFMLKKFLQQHEEALSPIIDFPAAMAASSVAEFDRHVYMRLHGYTDLDAYWKDNNPMRAVENIGVPVLCLNAKDDPVCTYGNINWSIFDINPNAMLGITTYGSHCGYYETTSSFSPFHLKSWATKAALDYLNTALRYRQQPST